MIFKDLITLLKNIKTENDVTPQLADELFNAAIVSSINLVIKEEPNSSTIEAIELARMTMLKHFDLILMDALMEEAQIEQEE